MWLETNSIYGGSTCNEISDKLLIQVKPILIVGNDPIIVDIELIVWIIALDIFVDLWSDVAIAGLVHVEGMVIGTLIYHLIDNIPVDHSKLIEMIHRLVNVIVNNLLKFCTQNVPSPAWIVSKFGPK